MKNVPAALPLLALLLACPGPLRAAASRTLAFYTVRPAAAPPVVDGRLDDPAWAAAERATDVYVYWRADPPPGVLKTEFRMLHDARGIYLAVWSFDERAASIKAEKVTRDDPGLWTDDCVELYFDPEAKAIGYVRMVSNALGVRQDSKRLDAANISDSWNGEGWHVATSRSGDGWLLEGFFPWSDLGKEARAGDLWMFDLVRYSYSTGAFRGITWSPGGNYNAPQNFGYLYFSDGRSAGLRDAAALLSQRVNPPWMLPADDGFFVCAAKGAVAFSASADLVSRETAGTRRRQSMARDALAALPASPEAAKGRAAFDETSAKLAALPGTVSSPIAARETVRTLGSIAEAFDGIYWEARLQGLLGSI